jgi:hypothetical protein
MMKKILQVWLFCLAFQQLNAQDSIASVQSEAFNQRYRLLAADAVSQPLLQDVTFNIVEAGYKRKKGEYRLAQDASSQRDFYFRTSGTRRIKSFLVSGSFGYERVVQDSTAYTLRYDLHGASPYYFYTVKKGHWDIGHYSLNGVVSKTIGDKFTVAAAGHYNSLNGWRSSDPRPEYFDQYMEFAPATQYRFSDKQLIGIGGRYIKRRTETSVEYRNDNYSMGGGQYPEYITYLQYGYGRQKNQSTRRNIRSKATGWAADALYQGKFSFGELTVKGSYRQIDSEFFLPGTQTGDIPLTVGFFYEDIADVTAQWRFMRPQYSIDILAAYQYHYGQDLNTEFSANNYLYSFEQLSIRPVYTRRKDNLPVYEILLDARLSDLYRADGSSNVLTDYQVARGMAQAAGFLYFGEKQFLKAGLAAEVQLPVSSKVQTPTQSSAFTQGVVIPDAYYQRATSFTGRVDLLYSFPVDKANSFIRLQSGLQQAAIKQNRLLTATQLPGKQRWFYELTIGVTL